MMEKNGLGVSNVRKPTAGEILDYYTSYIDYLHSGVYLTLTCFFVGFDYNIRTIFKVCFTFFFITLINLGNHIRGA